MRRSLRSRKKADGLNIKSRLRNRASTENICEFCQKIFKTEFNLTRHKDEMHSSSRSKCETCDVSFLNEVYAEYHYKRYHSNLDVWLSSTPTTNSVIRHSDLNKGNNKISNLDRSPSFSDDEDIKPAIISSPIDEFLSVCIICKETFLTKQLLFQHKNEKHSQPSESDSTHRINIVDHDASAENTKFFQHKNVKQYRPSEYDSTHTIIKVECANEEEQIACELCQEIFTSDFYLSRHKDEMHSNHRINIIDHDASAANTIIFQHKNEMQYRPSEYDSTHTIIKVECADEEEQIACELCQEIFTSDFYLSRHKDEMHCNKKIKLEIDGVSLINEIYAENRYKENNSNVDVWLPDTPTNSVTQFKISSLDRSPSFSDDEDIKPFINSLPTEEFISVCNICEQTFLTKQLLFEHKDEKQCQPSENNSNHRINILNRAISENNVCEICHRIFKTELYLLRHRDEMHSNNKSRCETCGVTFLNELFAENHFKRYHSNSDVWLPSTPSNSKIQNKVNNKIRSLDHSTSFSGDEDLKPVINSSSTEKFVSVCNVCKQTFLTKQLLLRHKNEEQCQPHRTHKIKWEDRDYEENIACEICHRIFVTNLDLLRHNEEVHNNKGAPCISEDFTTDKCVLVCNICDQKFLTKKSLVRHQNEKHSQLYRSINSTTGIESFKIINNEDMNEPSESSCDGKNSIKIGTVESSVAFDDKIRKINTNCNEFSSSTYRIYSINNNANDSNISKNVKIREFVCSCKSNFKNLIQHELTNYTNFDMNCTLSSFYSTDIPINYRLLRDQLKKKQSNNYVTITSQSNINDVYKVFIYIIESQINLFQKIESELVSVKNIYYLEFHVKSNLNEKFSFIPLPQKISVMKAVINIKNEDNACFAWCLVAALESSSSSNNRNLTSSYTHYTKKFNCKKLEKPLKLNEIQNYLDSINNNNNALKLSVNVFGLENTTVIGPIFRAKIKRENHVNLLLIRKSEKLHYCWITNLAKLIKSQRELKDGILKTQICDDCLTFFSNKLELLKHQETGCNNSTPMDIDRSWDKPWDRHEDVKIYNKKSKSTNDQDSIIIID